MQLINNQKPWDEFVLLEQYFNPELINWSVWLSYFFMSSSALFFAFNGLLKYFLVWDPITGETEQDRIRKCN